MNLLLRCGSFLGLGFGNKTGFVFVLPERGTLFRESEFSKLALLGTGMGG
jgi:hypothetical protein